MALLASSTALQGPFAKLGSLHVVSTAGLWASPHLTPLALSSQLEKRVEEAAVTVSSQGPQGSSSLQHFVAGPILLLLLFTKQ